MSALRGLRALEPGDLVPAVDVRDRQERLHRPSAPGAPRHRGLDRLGRLQPSGGGPHLPVRVRHRCRGRAPEGARVAPDGFRRPAPVAASDPGDAGARGPLLRPDRIALGPFPRSGREPAVSRAAHAARRLRRHRHRRALRAHASHDGGHRRWGAHRHARAAASHHPPARLCRPVAARRSPSASTTSRSQQPGTVARALRRIAGLLPLPGFLRRRMEDGVAALNSVGPAAEHGVSLAGKATAVVVAAALAAGGAGVATKASGGGLSLPGGAGWEAGPAGARAAPGTATGTVAARAAAAPARPRMAAARWAPARQPAGRWRPRRAGRPGRPRGMLPSRPARPGPGAHR